MTVDTAIRNQADQMQRPVRRPGCPHRTQQRRIFKKTAILDGVVDTHQVLPDDAAAAYGHVSDFGITHLAGGQTHATSGRFQRGQRILGEIAVEIGRIGLHHRIMSGVGVNPESVQNNK